VQNDMSTVMMWSKSKPHVEFIYIMADVLANSMACHPRATYHIAGWCHLVIEFTVTIPEPHVTLQGARIPSAILKIVFRHILFFFVFDAVYALTSGGFRIVTDTLVIWSKYLITLGQQNLIT